MVTYIMDTKTFACPHCEKMQQCEFLFKVIEYEDYYRGQRIETPIKCKHCGEEFHIDTNGFEDIEVHEWDGDPIDYPPKGPIILYKEWKGEEKREEEEKVKEREVEPSFIFCRFCGTKNSLEAVFCQKCGKRL